MNRRSLFAALASLAVAAPALAAMPRPRLAGEVGLNDALARGPLTEEDEAPAVLEAQYRRHRRCRWETRQVRYRDRWGRLRWRMVRRQVCW